MNKNIIKKYVQSITKNDIYNFGLKQEVNLNDDELNTIYNSITNDIDLILEDTELYLCKVKNKFCDNTYIVMLNLLNKYKKFIE